MGGSKPKTLSPAPSGRNAPCSQEARCTTGWGEQLGHGTLRPGPPLGKWKAGKHEAGPVAIPAHRLQGVRDTAQPGQGRQTQEGGETAAARLHTAGSVQGAPTSAQQNPDRRIQERKDPRSRTEPSQGTRGNYLSSWAPKRLTPRVAGRAPREAKTQSWR